MRSGSQFALTLAATLSLGCFRMHYVNLSPNNPLRSEAAPTAAAPPVAAQGSWRSFFLFGWVPAELRIDAARACGSRENIDSIRTEQTFVQGLVESVAGYYVNIYAPYDGAVLCKGAPQIVAPAATPEPPQAPAPSAAPVPVES